MSQVTEQSVRFQTALASIKLIQASAVLDLTEDDFDFLTSKDRKSGSAGMPRPISYAVFCLKKKSNRVKEPARHARESKLDGVIGHHPDDTVMFHVWFPLQSKAIE